MAQLFKVHILTPDKTIYEGDTDSLVAPGQPGYLGILANHAPLVTNLAPGKITFVDTENRLRTFHSDGKGFLRVINNRVTLLLDSVEERS